MSILAKAAGLLSVFAGPAAIAFNLWRQRGQLATMPVRRPLIPEHHFVTINEPTVFHHLIWVLLIALPFVQYVGHVANLGPWSFWAPLAIYSAYAAAFGIFHPSKINAGPVPKQQPIVVIIFSTLAFFLYTLSLLLPETRGVVVVQSIAIDFIVLMANGIVIRGAQERRYPQLFERHSF